MCIRDRIKETSAISGIRTEARRLACALAHCWQAVVFERYFPEDVPAARTRYKNETRRLYEVLNNRLETGDFLAGEISIADIATWAWVHTYRWPRIAIDDLEHLTRWINSLGKRRAFKQGILLPPPAGRADIQKARGASIVTK